MPIEFKRSGDTCEKCNKPNTEVGKITHYTKHGADLLLCSKCLESREKPYTEICPKCKRVAYEHGGLTYYDESDTDDSNDYENSDNFNDFHNFDNDEKPPSSSELMCMECHQKKVAKVRKIRRIKLTIKNFAKDHWMMFWIMATVGILSLIVALLSLWLSST